MSNPIPTSFLAGPYVIRNRYNSTVVHIQHADAIHQGIYSVQAFQQDEGQFNDQQIWWIEPLADYDTDSAKGVVYSITSPGRGKLLEGSPESGTANELLFRHILTMWQVGPTQTNTAGDNGRGGD